MPALCCMNFRASKGALIGLSHATTSDRTASNTT
jgi:hypothetical protein